MTPFLAAALVLVSLFVFEILAVTHGAESRDGFAERG